MSETVANSRFQILDTPAAAPAKCAVCGFAGGDRNRKFADFGLSLEFYGAVYFCTDCLKAVAVQIGMTDEHSVSEINALRRFYTEKIEALVAFLSGDYLETYRNLLEQHLGFIRDLVPTNPSILPAGTEQVTKPGVKTAQQNSSTISGERPDDVSGSPSGRTSNDFSFDF